VSFTLENPSAGQLGVADGVLVDRAFGDGVGARRVADVRRRALTTWANALAPPALARGHGVPAEGRPGRACAGYVPEPHRNALVGTVAEVSYVDDSRRRTRTRRWLRWRRTNGSSGWPVASSKAWTWTILVRKRRTAAAGRRAAGVDRAQIAPPRSGDTRRMWPVVDVASTDDGVMIEVVEVLAGWPSPADTVLLAPAAASLDMFPSYGARGDSFAWPRCVP